MLWYNNPSALKAVLHGRGVSTVDERNRLMRLVRTRTSDA